MKSQAERKVMPRESLLDHLALWRSRGETVVFTNGVFDVLHRGHLESIERAASFGDRLVVGVNSDHSARMLDKGPDRPLNSEADRAALIAALSAVDAVTIFDEPTPWELLRDLRPDVLAKGGDYRLEEIVGREFAGRVERIELVTGYSTTGLVERVRSGGRRGCV